MREEFLKELNKLHSQLHIMVSLVENAIDTAIKALVNSDINLCKTVYGYEVEINQLEKEIDRLCADIFLKQQPVAKDFNIVYTAQKIIVDLERMGDNAEDISKIVERISSKEKIKEYVILPKMAEETIKLIRASLNAFINNDISKLKEIDDDVIDQMFEEIKSEISEIIIQDPRNIDTALDILMIAKYFEKQADHAVNISKSIKKMW